MQNKGGTWISGAMESDIQHLKANGIPALDTKAKRDTFITQAAGKSGNLAETGTAVFGKAGDKLRQEVLEKSSGKVDIGGAYLELNARDIGRMAKGNAQGGMPYTLKDLTNIPEAIMDYDEVVSVSGNKGSYEIQLAKKTGGYVSIIRLASGANGALSPVSLIKVKDYQKYIPRVPSTTSADFHTQAGAETPVNANQRQIPLVPSAESGYDLNKDAGNVGKYTQKIRWGIQEVDVRPAGKGFFGKRTQQINARVEAYELKINPNNESYYLKHPNGGYVQYENMINNVVMDGKLIIQQKSFYHVNDLPEFARNKVLQEAIRQVEAADSVGYTVEWLISDSKAVSQMINFFRSKNINIVTKYLPE